MSAVRRFVVIGVASTLAYLVIFAALRGVASATLANAAALLITAVANTWANRRYTFGVGSRDGAARDHVGGLIALAIALGIITSSIGLLQLLAPGAGRVAELVVLVAANALATMARFVVLRAWFSHTHRVSAKIPREMPARRELPAR